MANVDDMIKHVGKRKCVVTGKFFHALLMLWIWLSLNISFVETVSKSFVVLGYIRGRVLVENGDLYEDLQDIVYGKLGNGLNNYG